MDQFLKARLKLTAWYVVVSMIVLAVFTAAAITIEVKSFDKIQDALSNRVQRPNLTALLEKRLDSFESDYQGRLLMTDCVLIIFSAFASYFLAGKTLRPIEEMVKEQESFAAEASHELRTPLAVMGMELETLRRTNKKLPKVVTGAIENNLDEIKRMGKIVDQLLTLVRPTIEGKEEVLKLGEVADEMVGTIKSYWSNKKKLKITLSVIKEAEIRVNKDYLKQILMILLDNAGKYTPDGGRVEVIVDKTGGYGKIMVKDTGVGIEAKDLKRIFERFYRGSNVISKGSGLGLAIAKKLVEEMRGKISVTSQKNKGSEFVVRIPVRV